MWCCVIWGFVLIMFGVLTFWHWFSFGMLIVGKNANYYNT